MRSVDVNVLVYAHRPESPNHERYRGWLDDARRSAEPFGLAPIVGSGFLRVVTHPRIFKEPSPLATALDFLEELHRSPAVTRIVPGRRHWQLFTELCTQVDATGNRVPDMFLAALAIEQGATWVSADRGFAGIPGLRWKHPLDD